MKRIAHKYEPSFVFTAAIVIALFILGVIVPLGLLFR